VRPEDRRRLDRLEQRLGVNEPRAADLTLHVEHATLTGAEARALGQSRHTRGHGPHESMTDVLLTVAPVLSLYLCRRS